MEGSQFVDITETSLLKQGDGTLLGVTINSHTSGTLKLIDGFTNGVAATTDLTSSGAMVPADYAIGTLTSTGTAVADGATVVVGATGGTSITYTARTTPSSAYEVAIGSTADGSAFLSNLKKAINGTGQQGVTYVAGTLPNPDIIAYTLTSTTLLVGFRTIGTGGNAYTTTETSNQLSWGGATLAGGVSAAAATFTLDTLTYTATLTLGDTLGLAIPNQVRWVTSEAVFLDNVKSAVNYTGTLGTDYSASTIQHPTVKATTNTNTVQTFVARKIGTGGNSIVTTETMGNYAFTGATMASGTLTDGRVMHNTITFGATERYIPIPSRGESFVTGLLAVVGGTADITLNYK